MREFTVDQLEDLAFGAAVLGTGGGGNPYIGKLLARESMREHGPITIVDPEELADDALVVPAAMMGAPTVMVEKIPSGDRDRDRLQGARGGTSAGRSRTRSRPRRAGSTR